MNKLIVLIGFLSLALPVFAQVGTADATYQLISVGHGSDVNRCFRDMIVITGQRIIETNPNTGLARMRLTGAQIVNLRKLACVANIQPERINR